MESNKRQKMDDVQVNSKILKIGHSYQEESREHLEWHDFDCEMPHDQGTYDNAVNKYKQYVFTEFLQWFALKKYFSEDVYNPDYIDVLIEDFVQPLCDTKSLKGCRQVFLNLLPIMEGYYGRKDRESSLKMIEELDSKYVLCNNLPFREWVNKYFEDQYGQLKNDLLFT
jgi:hypothetical protein